jgi:hypothetical protein
MSHFVVMVVGEDVEGQLAPYQENNMGDCPEEYLEFNDEEDECREAYEEHSEDYATFEEFVEDYYGYKKDPKTGKYGYWENPNNKWDWWVVGGRWTGYFPVKSNAKDHSLGETGVFGTPAEAGTADSILLKDIDLDRTYQEAEDRARESFTEWRGLFETYGQPESWTSVRERFCGEDFDQDKMTKAREFYQQQPAIKEFKSFWDCPVETMGFDEEVYVQRCRNRALVPYAIVKDGKWHGKGDMGWWGMSSNECDQEEWNEQFQQLLSDLPPDTRLTVVDCHI